MACPGQPDVLRLEAMKSEFEPEKSPPMTCPENEGSSVVVLAKDEGVKKYILTKGKGDKEGKRPQRDAKCFVHYTVYLAKTGEEIFTTLGEDKAPVEIISEEEIAGSKGLMMGIYSMKKRERCALYVSSKYAYGEKGNFSFPSVPPNTDLVYSVLLVGFLKPKEEKPRSEMLFEERLAAAQRRREWGKEKLDASIYWEAFVYFTMGLSYLEEDMLFQLEDKDRKKADKIRHPLLLYASSSMARLKKHGRALKLALQVTFEDPSNGKAWYRVAKAYRFKGVTDSALKAIEKAKRREPDNGAIQEEYEKIKEEKAKLYLAEKTMYTGIFNKTNSKKGDAKEKKGEASDQAKSEGKDKKKKKGLTHWLRKSFGGKSSEKTAYTKFESKMNES